MAPSLFPILPIQVLALALNGKRAAAGDLLDPRPVVRLYVPHTRVSYLLTETSPDDPNMAWGLADEDDDNPRMKHVNLATLAERGAELDETFQGRHPVSHYRRAAEVAGFAVIDTGLPRMTGTR